MPDARSCRQGRTRDVDRLRPGPAGGAGSSQCRRAAGEVGEGRDRRARRAPRGAASLSLRRAALPAVPALGATGRGGLPLADRHPHPPRLWPVARLSRGARLRRAHRAAPARWAPEPVRELARTNRAFRPARSPPSRRDSTMCRPASLTLRPSPAPNAAPGAASRGAPAPSAATTPTPPTRPPSTWRPSSGLNRSGRSSAPRLSIACGHAHG